MHGVGRAVERDVMRVGVDEVPYDRSVQWASEVALPAALSWHEAVIKNGVAGSDERLGQLVEVPKIRLRGHRPSITDE